MFDPQEANGSNNQNTPCGELRDPSFTDPSVIVDELVSPPQLSSSYYWASITPLICGGLGPTVTLIALSGSADRWRTENLPDGTARTERDPTWVVASTAVAVVAGFIANIFLFMRMVGRGNQKHMQYMCIALWALECTYRLFPIVPDYSYLEFRYYRSVRRNRR